jgi:ribonuclease BN (tRNA processing enzyme)
MLSAPAAGSTRVFLESAKGTLLVDCGASSLVALKAHGLDPNHVDGIVLSHLHGDHFGATPVPPARRPVPGAA